MQVKRSVASYSQVFIQRLVNHVTQLFTSTRKNGWDSIHALRKETQVMRITLGLLFFLYTTCPIGQSGGVGEVAFSNSGSPAAQSEFLRALAHLHNFEYQDAPEHFRRAEEIDPGFVMAYWGEDMTKNHGIWHQQDLSAAREVLSRFGATAEARRAKAPTEREKEYLGTIEIIYGEGAKEERDKK